jgi:monoamine oxidase
VVLEARERVGGRLETTVVDGQALDLGGAWIGASHVRAKRLADSLGLETWLAEVNGVSVVCDEGQVRDSRRYQRDHPLATFDYRVASWRLDRLARTITPAAPWEVPNADVLDAKTVEEWLAESAHTERARRTLSGTIANIFSAEPGEVSLLHALFYLRSNGGLGPLLGSTGGAQERLVVGGAARLADGLAESLGEAIELGAAVHAVTDRDNRVVLDADRITVEATSAIIAIPPYLAADIAFDPGLPASRVQLMHSLARGDVIRAVSVYDTAFWREDGLAGEIWGPELPCSFTHDMSPPDGRPGVLATFFVGERARRIRALTPPERRVQTLDALARCLGPGAACPLAHHERDWRRDPWTGGGYSASLGPGMWSRNGSELRRSVGRIAWAGTETATEHAGYAEGALQSGERAAGEVLALVRDGDPLGLHA